LAGAAILTKATVPEEASSDPVAGKAPLIRPERYGFFDKLLFAVFVLAVPPLIASNGGIFGDGDVSWHIAAGRWIMEHGRIPTTDPFSHSMPGHPWVAHEWLPEIAYAFAFDQASFAGVATVVALALMSLAAITFAWLRPRAGPIALLAAFASLYLVLQPFYLARPHVIAWVFLAGWTASLLAARSKNQLPSWWLLPLMLVWANVHASFLIGFVAAGAIGLDDCIEHRWNPERVLRWVAFGVAGLLVTLINPSGIQGLIYPFSVSGMSSLPAITEWGASTPQFSPYFYVVLLAMTGLVLLKRPQFSLGELLLLLLTLGMAFMHLRHQAMFIIIAVMIVTPKLSDRSAEAGQPLFYSAKDRRVWLVGAALLAAAILGLRAIVPLTPKETYSNPRGLIAHVPAELRDQPVLNEYSMGGPLILAGIKPFIDGRSDMYGDAFTQNYLKIVGGDRKAFGKAVRRYGIRWTMLQKGDGLVEVLDASPEWKRLYSDRVGVIHVQRNAPRAPLSGKQNESQDRG
jgi:hypothetical protein